MLSRHGREGAHRVLIVLSQARWSGNDGGENCRKRARVGQRGREPQGHMRTRHQKEGVTRAVRIGPSDLSGCSRRATCRTRAGRGKGRALWHGIGPDGRSTAAHGGLAIFLTSPMARRNSQRAEKGGARRKFRNRQPGSARARLMNSFLPKFRYRRSRPRPNAPVGAVPAACELRACNSLLIYIPGKQPALGYCKQVK